LGLTSALLAFGAAAVYTVVQLLQILKLVAFPWDAIFIYASSLCIAPPFLVAMVALHHGVPPNRRVYTQAAVSFASMYATYVSLNYVVQLATVIPAARHGGAGELRLLEQTPHSLFWDVDALGYFCMGAATLMASPAFARVGIQRWARRLFLAHAAVTPLIAVVYFYPRFSTSLLLLGIPWGITAPGAILSLALVFREQGNPGRAAWPARHLAPSRASATRSNPTSASRHSSTSVA
jgi:hypothetical protein